MSSLRDFLGTSLETGDEALILLRLMGRPFGKPFNPDIGEEPDDALRAFLHKGDEDLSAPFLSLIGKLLDPTFPPASADPGPLETLFQALEDTDRAAFAFQLVKLIESASAAVDADALRVLSRRFAPGPQIAGPALSAFWHLLLSQYSTKVVPDDEISVSRRTILDPAFINGPIVATALQRPFLFYGTIVPILFEAMRERDELKQALPALKSAMRAGFSALYREPVDHARRKSHLRLFASQLEELLASGTGKSTAEAALDGAARATLWLRPHKGPRRVHAMPFAELALLEAGMSRGRARAEQMSPRGRDRLEEILDRYVDPIRETIKRSMGDRVDPALATNFNPYFEGIYLRIWQSLLQRAGMKIEMKEHTWGAIVPKLLAGDLSFAIWNDYVGPEFLHDDRSIHRTNHPLLEYDYYPLVLRRDVLEDIISTDLPKNEVDASIAALTSGRPIPSARFQSYGALRGALRGLKLGLVGHSEIEEIAQRALGNGYGGRPMQSDKAVELLVDGGLDGAFLGGVQAAYLAQRFGHAVVTLTELERVTPMHLWFNGPTYEVREYPRVVRPLLHAWKVTCDIWKDATDGSKYPGDHEHLRRWILNVASRLNYGVSGSEWGMRTPISSWKMISKLATHHNRLLQPESVEIHRNLSQDEITKDATTGVVLHLVLNDLATDQPSAQQLGK
jgi:hypothetical protein